MSQEAEIRHWKAHAAQAERLWQRHTRSGRRRLENRAEMFRSFLGSPPPNAHLLELGCGTGAWTEILAATSFRLTSLDISEDLLAIARPKFARDRVKFLCGDVEQMSFPDRHFDCVCGISVLHHLDLRTVLREVFRVLKPGGKLWFSEPNMLNPQIMVQKNVPLIKRWSGDTPDETAFFRWPLARALRRAGFEEVRVLPFDFLHPQVPAWFTDWADRLGRILERMPTVREIAGSLALMGQRPPSV